MAHGKDTSLYVAEFVWSTLFRNSSIGASIDMAENTTYGSEAKTYEPGLSDSAPTLEGLLTDAAKVQINTWQTGRTLVPVTRVLDAVAIGAPSDSFQGYFQNVDDAAPVGDVVVTTITIQAEEGVDHGVVLQDTTPETGAGNGTTVDQAAGSTDGGVGYLHLVAFTGTDIDITIQDSPNDSTWLDLITFTQATAATSERLEVAGSVDRYIRAEWSGTFTSATFVVTFGRR